MGLFNSGKNEKVEKVSKYERHYNVPPNSSRRRSSKHRSHQGEPAARAMSQPPLMRMGGGGGGAGAGGFYRTGGGFNPAVVGAMGIPQVRYPIQPFDLSKYASPAAFSANPFGFGQMGAMNLPPGWNKGIPLVNFPQGGWGVIPPSNYGYMPAMKF
jgi:hypothetical protein